MSGLTRTVSLFVNYSQFISYLLFINYYCTLIFFFEYSPNNISVGAGMITPIVLTWGLRIREPEKLVPSHMASTSYSQGLDTHLCDSKAHALYVKLSLRRQVL